VAVDTKADLEAKVRSLEKQVSDLAGILEELDILVQPNGSIAKFLQLRGFEKAKSASA
jgi:hypothetical protein